jgi:hypothetical protein
MVTKPRPKWPPRLVPFLPSLQHSEEQINQNVFMFVEDISRPMPVGSGRKKHFSVLLTGDENEQERALQVLDGLSEHPRYSVEEKLSNAIDTLARKMVWDGRAQFELIPREDGTTHFHAVPTKKFFRLFAFAVQYLNAEDRDFWKSPALRWVSRSALWHVDIPKKLGGRRGYRRVLSALRNFSNLGPRFWNLDMRSGKNLSSFDLNAYVLSNNIFRYKVTHLWGWNCRLSGTEKTTEFYNMYRSAASEEANSIFRNHIISEINALLKRMSIKCSIAIEGLPSPADAQKAMRELVTGEMSFKEFLDIKYRN